MPRRNRAPPRWCSRSRRGPTAARSRRSTRRVGAESAVRTNRGTFDRLPQDYADMLGWEGQARALGAAYRALPPRDQRDAVIIGGNYGEGGAAEFYGSRYRLPPVVSPAGSFWFFGLGDRPGRVA